DVRRIALLDGRDELVAPRVRTRLVAAQRQKRPQVVGEGGVVVDDRDERFLQCEDSISGNVSTADPRGRASSPAMSCGDQRRPPRPSITRLANGNASPRPPRIASNSPGTLLYTLCTCVSSATTTTAAARPSV